MSRSGYSDDIDQWVLIKYRGMVASASRGCRGQIFFKKMAEALDSLPEKRLIAHDLQTAGEVCAIGAVGYCQGMDMSGLDPEDPEQVAGSFNVATPLVREIAEYNDYLGPVGETPEHRWSRMRAWVQSQILVEI